MFQSIFLICIFMILLTACGKKFWEYDCIWVSEDPYIYMPNEHEGVIIEIDGENYEVQTAWENDGSGIDFYENVSGGVSDEELIWEADVQIKKGELYLTIVKDNYGDNEGKVFILEQQPKDEEET